MHGAVEVGISDGAITERGMPLVEQDLTGLEMMRRIYLLPQLFILADPAAGRNESSVPPQEGSR